ncbi:Na/Pi cotransporter family protein [Paracoccus sp. M683]|uniref:Na/Pi cotransporter family protein n=1 Tax=Paracoccus sp. M683 TaxID=2594268 RepID=UPI00117DF16F|nr:Na/Pi cotransporter family protein [Paracoccus sp. M683]TRW96518.1 Na/Pi cotransporter family protein [Paracoccus sp. M683]
MILFMVNLAGAVALLLFSVRMIRTGVERAFMSPLRRLLRRATGSRLRAVAAGAGSAVLLQSSTAVAMLTAGFAATGTLSIIAGVALILGADLGSAIAAQILLSPIHWLVPVLLILGVTLFLKAESRRPRQAGRILVGLALVLLSLSLIREATEPLRDNPLVDAVLGRLGSDPASAFLLAALITYAMHSSIAAVLMFVTFAAQGLLPDNAAAAMVLGANLGGAAIPFVLTMRGERRARQIMLSNLLLRGGGAVALLLVLLARPDLLALLGAGAARQAINLHLAFNLTVALLALPFIPAVARLADALLPAGRGSAEDRPSALDEQMLSNPPQALINAQRELLRMAEETHLMLQPVLGLFQTWDGAISDRIAAREQQVDRMHYDIKLYLSRLSEADLTADQSRRAMAITMIANHLEDAGDQISANLVDLARRMHQQGVVFSADGLRELTDFHDRVLSNARLALNVLMTADSEIARQLIEEKDRTRAAEQDLQNAHLARLRANNRASVETTNLHQETVRALKQVNTDFTYVAYPIVEEAGDLRASRLA